MLRKVFNTKFIWESAREDLALRIESEYRKSIADGERFLNTHLYDYDISRHYLKVEGNFLWRLSIVLYISILLVMIIFKPLLYIITGKTSIRTGSRFYDFFAKWESKLR